MPYYDFWVVSLGLEQEMAVVVEKKFSAASARARTRESNQNCSSKLLSLGAFKTISLIILVGFLAWAYQAIPSPPPMVCGSPGGPPVNAPRIKLSDGRHLAYKEHGVPNNECSVHLWQGDQDLLVPATLQHYVAQQLPWIQYHEVPDAGHLFAYVLGMNKTLLQTLLLGK